MGLLLMFLALPNAALAMGQIPIWDSMRADAQETSGDQLDLLPETSVTCEGFEHYINSTNLEEKIEELKDCNIFTGKIKIKGTNLTDLTDFSSLQEIQNGLYIENNPSLTSLNGLENLHSVGNTGCCMDGIHIKNNSSLTDTQALSGLRRIKSHLIIWDNPGITTLAAFSGMTELWGISVSNTGITNLDGLQNIVTDERPFRLSIGRNQQLTSLNGLAPIENLNDLNIYENHALTDLSALNATTSATSIYIKNNESLEYLPAWENLSRVGFITIKDNPELKSLEGLEHISNFWGDVDAINRNAKGHSIKIINNDSLTSLEPLSNLNLIAFNASDLELDGLDTESLDNAHTLRIEDNDSLARCEIEAFIRGAYSYSEEWNPMTFHQEQSSIEVASVSCSRVCEGDYLLSSDSLEDGTNDIFTCGIITGDLTISDFNGADLQSIDGISAVHGGLTIKDSSLENLTGLEHLRTVTGTLRLDNLPYLDNLEALTELEELGSLYILSDVTSLTSVTSIHGIHFSLNSVPRVFAPNVDMCEWFSVLDSATGNHWGDSMWDGRWHPAGHSFGQHEWSWSDMVRDQFRCFTPIDSNSDGTPDHVLVD